MSFSRRTVYSSSVRSGGIGTLGTPGIVPGRRFAPLGSAASVYAGAGGAGSRISVSRTLSSAGGAFGAGFGAGYGAGLGSSVFLGGSGAVANEKEAMQDLNDRLATYLEQVRSLERENRRLETQIREFMARKGPSAHDWSPQWELIEELRDKILESTVENARTVLQIDNARLAADDFRVKFEAELAIRQSVDSDIAGLRKVLDDTNMTRLQLEGDIEALREELILLRKDHDQEVQELRAQVSQSALTVEVDAPRSQDLGKVLGELRAQYDALAQKNLEDLEKQWGQQITETTLEVTQSTKDLDVARGTVGALRRSLQTLEIDLEALHNQNAGLEAALAEAEARAGAHLAQVQLQVSAAEAELREVRAQLQRQNEQHRELLGLKDRLEAEIATYRQLLEGGDGFSLRDALDKETTATTAGTGTTQRVVTETREVKVRTY
ncbi:keratin, type I cytoskeletal 18 [Passer montanus]|uniref:keratin, type I cytoskeletal 18 n=1 Tax=Passer montanus TaxID=9160 RepID=UPI00195FDCEF|nr:keratin, type I cytoskeletal 18 [Passer montanus]